MATAIPKLLRAKIAANQASADGSLRTISSAEVTFSSTYSDGYTLTPARLGGPADSNGCKNAGLIDEVLSTAPASKLDLPWPDHAAFSLVTAES